MTNLFRYFRFAPEIFGGIFVAPAAVALALYPIGNLLGSVGFFPTHVPLANLTPITLVLLLVGVAVASILRDWASTATIALAGGLLLWPLQIGESTRFGAAAWTPMPNVDVASFDPAEWQARMAKLPAADASPLELMASRDLTTLAQERLSAAVALKAAVDAQDGVRNQRIAEIDKKIAERQNLIARICKMQIKIFGVVSFQKECKQHQKAIEQLKTEKEEIEKSSDGNNDFYNLMTISAAIASINNSLQWHSEIASNDRYILYFIASSIAFLVMIYIKGFRSPFTVAIVLTSLAIGIVARWPGLSWDGATFDLTKIGYAIVFGIFSAVTVRFLYRSYLDNRSVLQEFGRPKVVNTLLTAFVLWLPFLFVVLAINSLTAGLYTVAETAIYCGTEKCQHLSNWPVRDSDPERDTLRDDLHVVADQMTAILETEVMKTLDNAQSVDIDVVKAGLMARIGELIRPTPGHWDPDLIVPGCKLYRVKCYFFERKPKQMVERIYQSWRSWIIDRIDRRLQPIADKLKAAGQGVPEFKQELVGFGNLIAMDTKETIDETFLGVSILSMLQNALLLMVAWRGFLLIFARRLFKRDAKAPSDLPYLTLTHEETSIASITEGAKLPQAKFSIDSELQLDLKKRELLVKRTYDIDNSEPSTPPVPRMPSMWIFHRLLNRCYWLSIADRPDDNALVRFSLRNNDQLILWDIPKGFRVGFKWRDFVAMSNDAQLERCLSLRLGTLTLGHMMLPFVAGPGLLILRSNGNPRATHKRTFSGSPGRLASWVAGTKFQIVTSHRTTSVYIDDCHLEPQNDGWAMMTAGDGSNVASNVFREFLKLFRP